MSIIQKKYFENSDFESISSTFKCDSSLVVLMSTDDYSDQAIGDSIRQTGKPKELCASAYQMCIVGFGNKTYGKVKYNNSELDIKDLFLSVGVKLNQELGTKLEKSDLTPRRIQRFFRKFVYDYLVTNDSVEPYLFRKYSTGLLAYRATTFPGAEHFVEDVKAMLYLFHTYLMLDCKLGTNISDRIARVIVARKKLSQTQVNKLMDTFRSNTHLSSDFDEFCQQVLG